jgi:hypothetical protein
MSTIVGRRKGVKEKYIFLNHYLYCNFYLDTNDEKRKWHSGENDNAIMKNRTFKQKAILDFNYVTIVY